jgi:hypothetical protein
MVQQTEKKGEVGRPYLPLNSRACIFVYFCKKTLFFFPEVSGTAHFLP